MSSRRRFLAALGAAACPALAQQPVPARRASGAGSPHDPFGPIRPPVVPPKVAVTSHLGQAGELTQLLAGKVTALQLMFTGCSATCPIQGAIFAGGQQALGGAVTAGQWLSLSIDPLSDDPPALARWLQRFGAQPGWLALRPKPSDLDALLDVLRGRAEGVDRHVGQAFFFNRRAEFVFRTADLPAPAHLVDLMKRIDAMG